MCSVYIVTSNIVDWVHVYKIVCIETNELLSKVGDYKGATSAWVVCRQMRYVDVSKPARTDSLPRYLHHSVPNVLLKSVRNVLSPRS